MDKTEAMTPTEREQAIRIANNALDVSNADPDDDLRTVSRQFLRSIELHDKVRNQAIDECLSKLTKHRWDTWDNQMAELEQLKTKP